ncbi:MAG: FISUMP domain-containing protein [bacterium]
MKRIIYIIIFFLCYTAYSQSLSLFNVDASAFPTIKANFYALDVKGKPIANLTNSDFSITENGQLRTVTNVICPNPITPQKVSIAMSIDVSGSMTTAVELGKITAGDLCNTVPMPPSEFALQTCNDKALIIQDFTTNKELLLSKISQIVATGENDFVEHLLNPLNGLLNIAKNGKNKRIAVLYTDAWWKAMDQSELQACIDTCKKFSIQFYAVIYSNQEAEPNGIKKSLQSLAEATGGYFYDGIMSLSAAKDIAYRIQVQVQGGEPCQIEWTSGVSCVSELINIELKLIPNNLKSYTSYQSPNSTVAKLEIIPSSIKFNNAKPGIKKDTTITVTAKYADFNVQNIISTNTAYSITPTNFFLKSGESKDLTVSYFPLDSGYTYAKFAFENNICPTNFYASGGFPGKKPKIQTLKLIQPNGGEFFAVGNDTVITWEGVLPEEKVNIEYSIDNGLNWILVAKNATGLAYNWRVPKTPSNECLARVTANIGYEFTCPDVQTCNQIWMGCNLDVDKYRDGTPIPEVTDSTIWANLRSGAWCYYNNDTSLGAIYGKLYNWYAVNDPRGLAPYGWHIPTEAEWTELENCLGGSTTAGGKLKSTGTIEAGDGLWHSPNEGATNAFGFSALPGGYRGNNGLFYNMAYLGYWWSNTEYNTGYAWIRGLDYYYSYINKYIDRKEIGFAVRCIRD